MWRNKIGFLMAALLLLALGAVTLFNSQPSITSPAHQLAQEMATPELRPTSTQPSPPPQQELATVTPGDDGQMAASSDQKADASAEGSGKGRGQGLEMRRLAPKFKDGRNFGNYIAGAAFSPYSDKYVFPIRGNEGHGNVGIWLATISGGIERRLFGNGNVSVHWGHDDDHIVYMLAPPGVPPDQRGDQATRPVFLMDIRARQRRKIGQTTSFGSLSVAPTGDIAFLEQDTLRIVNPLTGVERRVERAHTIGRGDWPEITPPEPPPGAVDPSLSAADGVQVTPPPGIVWELTPSPEQTLSPQERAAQKKPTRQTRFSDLAAWGVEVRFKLSPHGDKVILHQKYRDRGALVVVDIDTGATRLLTMEAGNAKYPYAWSPDGQSIAYATDVRWLYSGMGEERSVLWRINLEDDRVEELGRLEGHHYTGLYWLPDETELLFSIMANSGYMSGFFARATVMNLSDKSAMFLFNGNQLVKVGNHGKQVGMFSITGPDGGDDPGTWISERTE